MLPFVLLLAAHAAGPLPIILMAGQSNMQGHGIVSEKDDSGHYKNGTLSYAITDPSTRADFAAIVNPDGSWVTLDDVLMFTVDQSNRSGSLTVGFGGESTSIGPELGFGVTLAQQHKERVLLLKTAWGGKSLAGDYRPPSAVAVRGNPQGAALVDIPGNKQCGVYYKLMVDTIREVLGNLETIVPNYDKEAGYQIRSLQWHQGWNDACDFDHPLSDPKNAAHEYEENLADFIIDMRKSLGEFNTLDNMPFVVGATGMGGKPGHEPPTCDADFGAGVCKALRMIWTAQMNNGNPKLHPEVGAVSSVDTTPFLRSKEDSPGTQGYHWWNNAESYYYIGRAMAYATKLSSL